ncbi:nitroreductase family protein [Kaarinaea lacus]
MMYVCKYLRIGLGLLTLTIVTGASAQETTMITLPSPHMEGGKPLMQTLKERHSTREFRDTPLSSQVLANLLWAAAGVNRPESGKRTAPSARDWREIDIYVATAEAVYRYDNQKHLLQPVRSGDLRSATGVQDFVATVPVNLVYVADLSRMEGADKDQQQLYSAADTGFIAQNVYLYCASEGLATVVRGSIDRKQLGKVLGLNKNQRIILAQSIGYPR